MEFMLGFLVTFVGIIVLLFVLMVLIGLFDELGFLIFLIIILSLIGGYINSIGENPDVATPQAIVEQK